MRKLMNLINKNKFLISIIIVMFIIISVPLYFYFNKFGDNSLSIKTNDWGNFGDYIGGVLTPMLTVINITVLLYLAYIARNYEKITFQIKLKHKLYQEIDSRLLIFEEKIINEKSVEKLKTEVLKLKIYFVSFFNKAKMILPEIEKAINPDEFNNTLDSLLGENRDFENYFKEKNKMLFTIQNSVKNEKNYI